MRKVIQIDEQGFFVEDVILQDDNEQTPDNCIEIEIPEGFYRPKWDGSEWVEGLTQEEIDAIKNAPTETTELEKLQQENEQLKASVIELTTYTAAQEERYNQAILELSQLIAGGNV